MSKKIDNIVTRYINFPWSTVEGFFNGDMFEDWLKDNPKNDPLYDLKQFFRIRDKRIYQQALEDIKRKLES